MEKKILDWLRVENLNDNIEINNLWLNNIEDYHEGIYLVIEKHLDEPLADVYILRLFGFGDSINLSQDYCKILSFDTLLTELPKLIKLIMDRIGD